MAPFATASRLALYLALAGVPLAGCGSGGDGTAPVVDVNARGRVALGGVGGASVEVYRVGAYDAPVATATASAGPDLATMGTFTFALTGVPADALFLLVASGGQAHDANEDGVADGPTPNLGKVHALASAADLLEKQVRLSAVSEVVYQRVRYFLEARYDDAYVTSAADAWTTFVLGTSLDGNEHLGHADAVAFEPRVHATATLRPYARMFRPFVARVLAGEPLTEAAFDLSREELHYEDLGNETVGVDLVGHRAYVCRGGEGLEIWSLADPTTPVLLGSLGLQGAAQRVQVVGALAYVIENPGRLTIVDVSVPATPSVVGSVAVSSWVTDLFVLGSRAYVVGGAEAVPLLFVVDVTTPGTPTILGDCELADAPTAVRAANGFAYVMEYDRVETVDVGDPTAPASEGTVLTLGDGKLDLAFDHLFVAGWGRLEVLALDAPAAPVAVASVVLPLFGPNAIRVRGTQAMVASGMAGFALVDVTDPTQPTYVGLVPTRSGCIDVDREGRLVVATEWNGGFSVVAAGTPPPSGIVARMARGQMVGAVEAVGNRVYLGTFGPSELVVVDTTDPLAPAPLGATSLGGSGAYDIQVQGARAYVGEFEGFYVFDVSNSSAPALLGSDAMGGVVLDVAAAGDVAYATIQDGNAIAAYDVSDPTAPELLTPWAIPGDAQHLAAAGNALVIAGGHDGAVVFDVSTPASPSPQGQAASTAWAQDVAVAPPYAYLTHTPYSPADHGIRVVDLTLLHTPTAVAFVQLPGVVECVAKDGTHLYVTSAGAGLHVVDIAAPAAPVHVGTIPLPANVRDIAIAGGYVYAAVGVPSGALLVLRAAQVAVP